MRNTQLRPLQISSTRSPTFISMLPSPGCRWPEKSKEKAVKSNLILRLIPPDLIMITEKNCTNKIYLNDMWPCCRQPAFKRVSESTEFKVKYLFKGAGVIDSQSKANTRGGTIQWTIKVRATHPPPSPEDERQKVHPPEFAERRTRLCGCRNLHPELRI